MVKHLPTIRETQVQSLGQEDLLEKEMATHSSTVAWKIPWTEKPGRLQSMGSQRVRHDSATNTHTDARAHTHTQDVKSPSKEQSFIDGSSWDKLMETMGRSRRD